MGEYPKPEPRPKKLPKPLKRTAIKVKPYALKRTPLKPSEKPIAQMSAKQAANLRKYEQGKREKYEGEPDVCTGCGRYGQISCSHLVARSHSFELVSEKQNHEMQCFGCADLTERGKFFALKNGLRLLERLWNGLGDIGRQRFWYVWNQWEQNRNLWEHSTFYDSEIHTI